MRNMKYHTAAAKRATKATLPITIPAMAPPDRPLLLVGLDTGEAVGARGVEPNSRYEILKWIINATMMMLHSPTDTGPEDAVKKYVAPYSAAVECRLESNVPLLTEFVSSVEYALEGYLELVEIW